MAVAAAVVVRNKLVVVEMHFAAAERRGHSALAVAAAAEDAVVVLQSDEMSGEPDRRQIYFTYIAGQPAVAVDIAVARSVAASAGEWP